MLVMDGIEAVRRIRSEAGPNKETRTLGLTAHGREEYRDRAISAGMDGFFTKPIRFSALRDVVMDAKAVAGEVHDGVSALDMAVIDDLVSVLGPDKVQSAGETFFTQTDAAIERLGLPDTDAAVAVRQMRGGAALLGLSPLINQNDATDANAPDISALRAAFAASAEAFRAHLRTASANSASLPEPP